MGPKHRWSLDLLVHKKGASPVERHDRGKQQTGGGDGKKVSRQVRVSPAGSPHSAPSPSVSPPPGREPPAPPAVPVPSAAPAAAEDPAAGPCILPAAGALLTSQESDGMRRGSDPEHRDSTGSGGQRAGRRASHARRKSIARDDDDVPWYTRAYDKYRTSFHVRFSLLVVGCVLLLLDPVTDYYAVSQYWIDGHVEYALASLCACLFFPWFSLWLHIRERRKAGHPVNHWMWMKMFILPMYELRAGVKAVSFLWNTRKDRRVICPQKGGRPSVADQVLIEIESMAGQEALFETFPQLCVQLAAFLHHYRDSVGSTDFALLLTSLTVGIATVIKNVVVWMRLRQASGLARIAASPINPDEFKQLVKDQENKAQYEIQVENRPAWGAVLLAYWAEDPEFFARKRVINMCGCGLIDQDLPPLLRALKLPNCQIETLGLGRNLLTEAGALALEEALMRAKGWRDDGTDEAKVEERWKWQFHPTVRRLVAHCFDPAKCPMLDFEVPPLMTAEADGLRADGRARRAGLELWNDVISGSQSREKAKTLITKFTVHCTSCAQASPLGWPPCYSDRPGAAELRVALWATKLRVDLSHCELRDTDLSVLWDAMQRPSCLLVCLRLTENNLGDPSAVKLAAAIASEQGCPQLREVYLGYNGIGDAGAEALADALRARMHRVHGAPNPDGSPRRRIGGKASKMFKLVLWHQREREHVRNAPLTTAGAKRLERAVAGYPAQVSCHGCVDVEE
eukprot:TRINITY_DN50645_c0_g1_i1.p1 TRINITY_DN50645_c0_g1~~TRINITY_DN50645_c0_g1_i1.p1  ORF type:complete len:761 (+),score=180.19 TRINITY_DN50645_c0_g1_i1:69-2285(+)